MIKHKQDVTYQLVVGAVPAVRVQAISVGWGVGMVYCIQLFFGVQAPQPPLYIRQAYTR